MLGSPQVQQRDVAGSIQVRDKLANKRGMLGRAALGVARHREPHGDHRLACKVDGAAHDVERDHGPVRRLRRGDDRTRFDCADGLDREQLGVARPRAHPVQHAFTHTSPPIPR